MLCDSIIILKLLFVELSCVEKYCSLATIEFASLLKKQKNKKCWIAKGKPQIYT